MLAAGVAFAVLPRYHDAQIKTAKTSASTIRQAVQSWQMTNNETSCPSMQDLVSSKQVDSANTKDPWNEEYAMSCSDDDVVVTSSGPDKKRGTKDDISVPEGTGAGTQNP
jgi:general secretion pathway protein G